MLKAKQRPFMNMNKGENILPFEKMKEQRMRERMERAQRALELRRYFTQHNPVDKKMTNEFISFSYDEVALLLPFLFKGDGKLRNVNDVNVSA